MVLTDLFRRLVGRWRGVNRLWLSPEEPPSESGVTASMELPAGPRFLALRYGWELDGRPQAGLLLLGPGAAEDEVEAAWIDSFHQSGRMMPCRGRAGGGNLSVTGTYPAPPGPDWGWRLELRAPGEDDCELVMTNISPDGEEALAVRMELTRARPS